MSKRPVEPWLLPCPCGSGLRLGQCCGPKQHVDMPPAWREAHRLWDVSRQVLGGYLYARHSAAVIADAMAPFMRPPEPGLWDEGNWTVLVESWLLYDWIPRGEQRTVAADWLASVAPNAIASTGPVIELVRATLEASLSFYQIERVVPSQGVELRDLLRDQITFVYDRSISFSASPWKIVCARLTSWSGVTIFDTMGPYPLEATWRSRLWDALGDEDLEPPLDDGALRVLGSEILELYDDAVSTELDTKRAPSLLANTDGHPMVLCEQTYRFATTDLGPLLDRLLDLGFEATAGAPLEDPNQDLDAVGDITLGLVDADRELLPGGGPINVASVKFERKRPGTLVLTTNSRERRERFAAMIEAELAPLVERAELRERDFGRFERWTPEAGWRNPDELEEHAPGGEAPVGLPIEDLPADVREALDVELARIIETASRAWPDQPVPALGGITPREAMRTERGRRAVEDLLRVFADKSIEPSGPGRGGLDIDLIRRELGL